jgi:hypothetical protein
LSWVFLQFRIFLLFETFERKVYFNVPFITFILLLTCFIINMLHYYSISFLSYYYSVEIALLTDYYSVRSVFKLWFKISELDLALIHSVDSVDVAIWKRVCSNAIEIRIIDRNNCVFAIYRKRIFSIVHDGKHWNLIKKLQIVHQFSTKTIKWFTIVRSSKVVEHRVTDFHEIMLELRVDICPIYFDKTVTKKVVLHVSVPLQ